MTNSLLFNCPWSSEHKCLLWANCLPKENVQIHWTNNWNNMHTVVKIKSIIDYWSPKDKFPPVIHQGADRLRDWDAISLDSEPRPLMVEADGMASAALISHVSHLIWWLATLTTGGCGAENKNHWFKYKQKRRLPNAAPEEQRTDTSASVSFFCTTVDKTRGIKHFLVKHSVLFALFFAI